MITAPARFEFKPQMSSAAIGLAQRCAKLRVLHYMLQRAPNGGGFVYPSRHTIAENCDLLRQNCDRALRELTTLGYIQAGEKEGRKGWFVYDEPVFRPRLTLVPDPPRIASDSKPASVPIQNRIASDSTYKEGDQPNEQTIEHTTRARDLAQVIGYAYSHTDSMTTTSSRGEEADLSKVVGPIRRASEIARDAKRVTKTQDERATNAAQLLHIRLLNRGFDENLPVFDAAWKRLFDYLDRNREKYNERAAYEAYADQFVDTPTTPKPTVWNLYDFVTRRYNPTVVPTAQQEMEHLNGQLKKFRDDRAKLARICKMSGLREQDVMPGSLDESTIDYLRSQGAFRVDDEQRGHSGVVSS